MRLFKSRLSDETKGFHCGGCLERYQKAKAEPACWKNACPIQDVAPDRHLNDLADAFLKFEALDMSPGTKGFQEKLLRDSGLGEESAETILEMKRLFAQYQRKEAEKAKSASPSPRRR